MPVIICNLLHLPPISAVKYRFHLPPSSSDRCAGHLSLTYYYQYVYLSIGNYILNDESYSLRVLTTSRRI